MSSAESRGENHEYEQPNFFRNHFSLDLGHRQARDDQSHEAVLMVFDADVMEEIYDESYLEASLDDDEIDAAEAGFMHGYLGRWKHF